MKNNIGDFMDTCTVHFDIPEDINNGLKSGVYERVGGTIRDSQTKQIVAMLREVPFNLANTTTILSQLNTIASIINIAVSVVGFVVVTKKLNLIEQKIDKLQKSLNELHYKYDVSIDAKFKGALNSAQDCFKMRNKKHSYAMGIAAINTFSEVQNIYIEYLNKAMEKDIQIADIYFNRLSLCYLAKTECYLEIEEVELAYNCIKEGAKILKDYCFQYTKKIQEFNKKSYETAQNVWMGEVVAQTMYGWIPFIGHKMESESAEKILPLFNQSKIKDETMEKIIDVQDTWRFFEEYEVKVKFINSLETSFHKWKDSPASSDKTRDQYMYIVPIKPIK